LSQKYSFFSHKYEFVSTMEVNFVRNFHSLCHINQNICSILYWSSYWPRLQKWAFLDIQLPLKKNSFIVKFIKKKTLFSGSYCVPDSRHLQSTVLSLKCRCPCSWWFMEPGTLLLGTIQLSHCLVLDQLHPFCLWVEVRSKKMWNTSLAQESSRSWACFTSMRGKDICEIMLKEGVDTLIHSPVSLLLPHF
jgi:hypothetical protein